MKTLTITLLLCLSSLGQGAQMVVTNADTYAVDVSNVWIWSQCTISNEIYVGPVRYQPQINPTNIVIYTTYTGTIQVGTNYFRLHENVRTNAFRLSRLELVWKNDNELTEWKPYHTNWTETSTNWTLVP